MAEILKGIVLVIIIVALFSLFKYKAPHGKGAMKSLGKAAILSILVQVTYIVILDKIIPKDIWGISSGSMSSVIAGILTPIALGVSPINAILVGISMVGFGIIPGFISGYLVSFLIRHLEVKFEKGLQIVIVMIIIAPIARFIAMGLEHIVNAGLLQIGQILTQSINTRGCKNACKRV